MTSPVFGMHRRGARGSVLADIAVGGGVAAGTCCDACAVVAATLGMDGVALLLMGAEVRRRTMRAIVLLSAMIVSKQPSAIGATGGAGVE